MSCICDEWTIVSIFIRLVYHVFVMNEHLYQYGTKPRLSEPGGTFPTHSADHGWRNPIWVDSGVSGSIFRDYRAPWIVAPLWQVRNFWLDASIGNVLTYLETTLECPNQAERSSDHVMIICNADRFAQDSVNPSGPSPPHATTSASPCRVTSIAMISRPPQAGRYWNQRENRHNTGRRLSSAHAGHNHHCPSAAPCQSVKLYEHLGRQEAYLWHMDIWIISIPTRLVCHVFVMNEQLYRYYPAWQATFLWWRNNCIDISPPGISLLCD